MNATRRRRHAAPVVLREVEKRLSELAKRTGRSESCYAREAILEHLDDLGDHYLAAARVEQARLSLEDVEKRLGLEDRTR